MALVTIQRSPTPTEIDDTDGVVAIEQTDGYDDESVDENRAKTTSSQFRNRSLSECYFAVKGAAVILPQTESAMLPKSPNSSGGEIQQHLQAMLHLLRPQDKLTIAVRLQSAIGSHTRYMAIVSTVERLETGEAALLGIDYLSKNHTTIGLVLPIWASTKVELDGDGGISVDSAGSMHVFKPVSVQAMWSVFQCLHKELSVASSSHYYPGGWTHAWTKYYESQISSTSKALISEWHYTNSDDSDLKADNSVDRYREKPAERAAAEKMIRIALKDIMQSVDLDDVTSKDIRNKLEERLEVNLSDYKEYIDKEMLVILGQMDKPSQIFPYLYLGTEWNASNWDELKQNNVEYILNMTKEVDNFFPNQFEYMKIRVSDEASTELLKHWNRTFQFISTAKSKNRAVLVHCKKGISRSSSTVIAYAMKAYGWSLDAALQYVKEKRNCITPNKGFMEQLKTFGGMLDASRNRHSAIFNKHHHGGGGAVTFADRSQSARTMNDGELIPWQGIVDSSADTSAPPPPSNDHCWSAPDDEMDPSTIQSSSGMLVASENIFKSCPSSVVLDGYSDDGNTGGDKVRIVTTPPSADPWDMLVLGGDDTDIDHLLKLVDGADSASDCGRVLPRQLLQSAEDRIRALQRHNESPTLRDLQQIIMHSSKRNSSSSSGVSSLPESDSCSLESQSDDDVRPMRSSSSSSSDSTTSPNNATQLLPAPSPTPSKLLARPRSMTCLPSCLLPVNLPPSGQVKRHKETYERRYSSRLPPPPVPDAPKPVVPPPPPTPKKSSRSKFLPNFEHFFSRRTPAPSDTRSPRLSMRSECQPSSSSSRFRPHHNNHPATSSNDGGRIRRRNASEENMVRSLVGVFEGTGTIMSTRPPVLFAIGSEEVRLRRTGSAPPQHIQLPVAVRSNRSLTIAQMMSNA